MNGIGQIASEAGSPSKFVTLSFPRPLLEQMLRNGEGWVLFDITCAATHHSLSEARDAAEKNLARLTEVLLPNSVPKWEPFVIAYDGTRIEPRDIRVYFRDGCVEGIFYEPPNISKSS